ncbi:MAG TPA: RNA polymerase-binding protein RbpA [Actinomycetes bacterium]|nr:RNA polymerase-binding protein RbpA [Actinomycetes bacterium]
MGEAMRGTRLGATSYESDTGVELAPRRWSRYDCPNGHSFEVPFSVEAEVPYTWECRFCRAEAILRDGEEPEAHKHRHQRTPWDMLLERRSVDDLEALLDERLTLLRDRGGAGVVLHEAREVVAERGSRRRAKVPGGPDRKSA